MKKAANAIAISDSEIRKGKCPIRVQLNQTKKGIKTSVQLLRHNSINQSGEENYQSILKELTATDDMEQSREIIDRAVYAMPNNLGTEHNINTIHQTLANFKPKDAIEAKLCVKEAALYAQGMNYLRKAENADMACHAEMYIKFAIRILRIQNETVEAISRYRRNGEQKMTVQHQYVNVGNGGKAIVSTLMTGGEG